jgi:FkbM family methyltransferase
MRTLPSARLPRLRSLANKAWHYLLAAAEQPAQVPAVAAAALRGVHIGEFLKLNHAWIRKSGIRTIVDVGAHEGEFASAARAVLPTAHLYAFEALDDCCRRLRQKFVRDRSFEAFQVAVGEGHGSVTFRRSGFSEASSVLPMAPLHAAAFPWTARTVPLTVSLAALDDYADMMDLQPKVLLKIDVQGYEDRVLRGARRLLAHVDYVLVEVCFDLQYEGQAAFRAVHELLAGAGLAYAGNMEQLLSPLDGSVMQADAFFVRERQTAADVLPLRRRDEVLNHPRGPFLPHAEEVPGARHHVADTLRSVPQRGHAGNRES